LNRDRTISEPLIIPRDQHSVSRTQISRAALNVLYRLKEAGYESYLVGGGVRDILLGVRPKDFDVATAAHPEQVKALFRNCRLIGRRFRLAHVRFGREIIEVATFRGAAADNAEMEGDAAVLDEHGRILRDNVYGSLEEDAWRRDFSINGLYYSVEDFSIRDHVGGLDDLRAGTIRLIGDPQVRYREDPVRMLRAVRIATKLGFSIEPGTLEPIPQLAYLLRQVPPARLFDETLKLFMSDHSSATFDALREFGLFEPLFPRTETAFAGPYGARMVAFVRRALANTEARLAQDKPVTPAFLFAALLWPAVRTRAVAMREEGATRAQALAAAAHEVTAAQVGSVSLPKRFSTPMREIWQLQPRFESRRGKRPLRLLEHPRFRAAYDFLLLRAETGDADPALAQWWTDMQSADPNAREALSRAEPAKRTRRRGRRRRKRTAESASS